MELQICAIEGKKLYYRADTHDFSMIREIWEEKSYAKNFPAGDKTVVLDIGGHNGYFSIYAAAHLHPQARVLSFEPVKENFDIFQKNIEANRMFNIEAHHAAVSERDGTLKLYLNRAHTGGHSIFKERVEVYHPAAVEEVEVAAVSFARIIQECGEAIGLCKIDCEGAEFDLLLPLEERLLKRIQRFALEFHEFGGHQVRELLQKLSASGFSVEHEFKPSKRGISFGMLWAAGRSG